MTFNCVYPVIEAKDECCKENPCIVEWFRPCDDTGGCTDPSNCRGCDTPLFREDIVDRVWLDAEIKAEQASITNVPTNPYKDEDWRYEIWSTAFRHFLMASGWH